MPQVGFIKAMKDYFGVAARPDRPSVRRRTQDLGHDEKLDFGEACAPSASTVRPEQR